MNKENLNLWLGLTGLALAALSLAAPLFPSMLVLLLSLRLLARAPKPWPSRMAGLPWVGRWLPPAER